MRVAGGPDRGYVLRMIYIFIPLLIAILGLLIFALSANPKINKIGEHLFWCGTLATLLSIHTWKLLL